MTNITGQTAKPKQPCNNTIKKIVSALGVIFGIGGMGHGFFEILQGNKPTDGVFIHAIGDAHRMWIYGSEPAFTIIPTFLVTGIAAVFVSVVIIIWSIGFLGRKNGPIIFLLLFILLFLVGGGIGHIIFFTIGWAFATRINKPLKWWRKVLPVQCLIPLSKLWLFFLGLSSVLILFALEIAIFGLVPGMKNPDQISIIMISSLCGGLVLLLLAFISGIAADINLKEDK